MSEQDKTKMDTSYLKYGSDPTSPIGIEVTIIQNTFLQQFLPTMPPARIVRISLPDGQQITVTPAQVRELLDRLTAIKQECEEDIQRFREYMASRLEPVLERAEKLSEEGANE